MTVRDDGNTMTMRLVGIMFVLLAVLVGTSNASNCFAVRRVVAPVVTPTVITPVVAVAAVVSPTVVATTFIPVAVPTFSITYAPPLTLAGAGYSGGTVGAGASYGGDSGLTAQIQALRAEIQQMRGSGVALNAAAPVNGNGNGNGNGQASHLKASPGTVDIGAALGKCVACHEGAVSKNKGGDFAIFDGNNTRKLSAEDSLKILAQVESGSMPKNGTLQEGEKSAIRRWLAGIK